MILNFLKSKIHFIDIRKKNQKLLIDIFKNLCILVFLTKMYQFNNTFIHIIRRRIFHLEAGKRNQKNTFRFFPLKALLQIFHEGMGMKAPKPAVHIVFRIFKGTI